MIHHGGATDSPEFEPGPENRSTGFRSTRRVNRPPTRARSECLCSINASPASRLRGRGGVAAEDERARCPGPFPDTETPIDTRRAA